MNQTFELRFIIIIIIIIIIIFDIYSYRRK